MESYKNILLFVKLTGFKLQIIQILGKFCKTETMFFYIILEYLMVNQFFSGQTYGDPFSSTSYT